MGGGGCTFLFIRKTILSHFIFSSRFMLFPTFIEIKQNSGGGGGGVCQQNLWC